MEGQKDERNEGGPHPPPLKGAFSRSPSVWHPLTQAAQSDQERKKKRTTAEPTNVSPSKRSIIQDWKAILGPIPSFCPRASWSQGELWEDVMSPTQKLLSPRSSDGGNLTGSHIVQSNRVVWFSGLWLSTCVNQGPCGLA